MQHVRKTIPEKHFTEYTHEISLEYEDETVPALSDGVCGDKKSYTPFKDTCKLERTHFCHFNDFKLYFIHVLVSFVRRWKNRMHVRFVAEGLPTVIMYGHMNKLTPIEMFIGNSNVR